MNSQASEPTIDQVIRMLEEYEKRNNAEVQQLRRDLEQANDNYNRLHANVVEYRGDITTSKLDNDGLKKGLEVLNTDIRGVREDYNGIHQ
jgi:chromosome segregation ATPase